MKTHAQHLLLAAALIAGATAHADVLLQTDFTGTTADAATNTWKNLSWTSAHSSLTGPSSLAISPTGLLAGGNVTTAGTGADAAERIGAHSNAYGSTWTSTYNIGVTLATLTDTISFTSVDLTAFTTNATGVINSNIRGLQFTARLYDSSSNLIASGVLNQEVPANRTAGLGYSMIFTGDNTINTAKLGGGLSGTIRLELENKVTTSSTGNNGTYSQYDDLTINGTYNATAIPEPSTYGLMGAGAVIAAAVIRRRRKVA